MVDWSQGLEVVALSDIGMRRGNNQDSHSEVMATDLASWWQRGHVFVVADGMGAHAAGELASKLAADNVPHTYRKLLELHPAAAIRKAINEANTIIHNRGDGSVDFQGMGTTCSTLVLLPYGAFIAHVGDSRVYRLRKNVFDQLTFDHSLVWEMTAAGQITADGVGFQVPKNVITRSLGPNSHVQVDLEGPLPLEVGDVYLLCSDGLTGPVHDDEIGLLLGCLPLQEAVQTLIDLANLRGGPDNITVIAARIKSPDMIQGDPAAVMRPAGVAGPHWSLWAIGGLLLAGAIGLVVQGFAVALASLLALPGLGCLGFAGVQEYFARKRRSHAAPSVLGKGPYRTYDCAPRPELAGKLAAMVDKLETAALTDNWPIPLERFQSLRAAAAQASGQGNHAQAVVHYAHALRILIGELRTAKGRNAAGNSDVDSVR